MLIFGIEAGMAIEKQKEIHSVVFEILIIVYRIHARKLKAKHPGFRDCIVSCEVFDGDCASQEVGLGDLCRWWNTEIFVVVEPDYVKFATTPPKIVEKCLYCVDGMK